MGLNWYDYGWRNYSPDIARWVNIDPLFNDLKFAHDNEDVDPDDQEEVYMSIINDLELGGGIYNVDNLNPYGYGYNNPVSFDDPDGRCPVCIFVAAALLYSEFANSPTNNKKADAVNYNQNKELKYIVSETILKRGGNIVAGVNSIAPVNKPKLNPKPEKSPAKEQKAEKTHQTYTKENKETKETYSGRTSGTCTPAENVANRDKKHHKNDEGFGPAKLDKSSTNKDAIRGREQQLIKQNGGAKSEGGKSGNAINGVSPTNPNAKKYEDAAKKEFGN